MTHLRNVIFVMIALLLSGCALTDGFVAVEKKFELAQQDNTKYRVKAGDTLYSIAWNYGLDFRNLASGNSISSPYVIQPGQVIDLTKVSASVTAPVAKQVKISSATLPEKNSSPKFDVKKSQTAPKTSFNSRQTKWQWPAKGAVIGYFSTKKPVNKGIDIAGRLGEPVVAASTGNVVYAGRGLRGYGNMVIIRHNDQTLSAYAHTSRILVAEGDSVKAGQKIAEIGSTDSRRSKLHFEIRKEGQPVNPMTVLPSR